ncbi:MAG TPA: NAD(P)/FAD-dependent oxidoreductase [Candidatus Acidoferrales bacterium]|nr:NAD(P)/FAD-dependent oxidoreductase [Candidatus Acidoferrales bacterium]
MTSSISTDVFIVGGGPAGLATAIAARQQGLRASVADSRRPPIDKSCGEGLMPHGVAALRSLGVAIEPRDGMPFRGIRFVDHELSARADFPRACGYGMRRTTLHRLLMERAREVGVEMHWGTHMRYGGAQRFYADGEVVRKRWIVGADGQNSGVRKCTGLRPKFEGAPRYGFRRHYRIEPWSDYVEVHWDSRSEIYVTPTGANDVCVAVLTRNPGLRIEEALREFPTIATRLAHATPTSRELGGACVSRSLEEVLRGDVLLVGDASCTVDAITGDGLSLAIEQAVSLAKALAKDDPALYAREHGRIVRLPRMMSRLMLMLGERRWMRRRAITRLSNHPGIFARMLAAHVGEFGAAKLTFRGLPAFLRNFLKMRMDRPVLSPGELDGSQMES